MTSPSCAGTRVLLLSQLWSTIACRGRQRLTSASTGLLHTYLHTTFLVFLSTNGPFGVEDDLDHHTDAFLFLSLRLLQLHQAVVKGSGNLPNELLYGRVGYLYALVFVNQQLGQDRIPLQYIQQVGRQQETGIAFMFLLLIQGLSY